MLTARVTQCVKKSLKTCLYGYICTLRRKKCLLPENSLGYMCVDILIGGRRLNDRNIYACQ